MRLTLLVGLLVLRVSSSRSPNREGAVRSLREIFGLDAKDSIEASSVVLPREGRSELGELTL